MWQVDNDAQEPQQSLENSGGVRRVYMLQPNALEASFNVTEYGDEGVAVSVLVSKASEAVDGMESNNEDAREEGHGEGGSLKAPGVRRALLIGIALQALQQVIMQNILLLAYLLQI